MSAATHATAASTSAIKGTVNDITDLPAIAEHNFIVEMQGSASTSFDDYYVQFVRRWQRLWPWRVA